MPSTLNFRPYARLAGISPGAFTFSEGFWGERRQALSQTILKAQYTKIVETGRIENFKRAAGKSQSPFAGLYFNDSDLYKWLEAASWTIAFDPDPDLAVMIENAITVITDAQCDNGYLNTYFMFDREPMRWTNLRDMHELYCAGHLFEAAAAHFQVTQTTRLLNPALKLADYIGARFNQNSHPGTPGHPEIELALVGLAEITGNQGYLELAQFFIDQRGQGIIGGSTYHQDHTPFRDMDKLTGHAVRAMYLCCGATDLYQHTGDKALKDALERLWLHMTHSQLYVSGGIGSRHQGEAIGDDYELPNSVAYAETCAAIGSVMWNQRMMQTGGDARYADLMEWTLFNAVLPGISLDHERYFYVNPLSDNGNHRRQEWFDCACCPPNIARLLASLPKYFFSLTPGQNFLGDSQPEVWIHTYAQGDLSIPLQNQQEMKLCIATNYPWQGEVEIEIREVSDVKSPSIHLRIPGWCRKAELSVNGKILETDIKPSTYVKLAHRWKKGDIVKLDFSMPVQLIQSHPKVLENNGRVAISRGPLLYCLEQADNPNVDLRQVILDPNQPFGSKVEPSLLGGIITLDNTGLEEELSPDWGKKLYRRYEISNTPLNTTKIQAIPYFTWANRSPGPMQVWIKTFRDG